jgi:predicted lysophospholipase L1 biosynthesis ABC-type transport system permease subunit
MLKERAKEIAIRKVLGASFRSVLARQSLEFLKLVARSTLLAWPIAFLTVAPDHVRSRTSNGFGGP